MGLWVDTPDDDGSGVLIHADGTPMTADEIEAMERRELADDEGQHEGEYAASFYDEPADPDGPSPEDDDILADPKVI